MKDWLIATSILLVFILFFWGFEITMYFYPTVTDAIANTKLRYNFYAVIIAILSYLALENQKGLFRLALGFIFGMALIDLLFRYFGIYGREKSDLTMLILSGFITLVMYIYKDKSNDGN